MASRRKILKKNYLQRHGVRPFRRVPSVALVAGLAIVEAQPAHACLTVNTSTTLFGSTACVLWQGGGSNFSITNTGSIVGNATALQVTGNVGTLTNSGTILGTSVGLQTTISTSISSVINGGLLGTSGIAGTIAEGLWNQAGATIGSVSNLASGTIIGAGRGIFNSGTIVTITNAGLLTGSGTVSGSIFGIDSSGGSIGSIINTGTIQGSTNLGITGTTGYAILAENAGTITSLSNNGGRLQGELGLLVRSGASLGTLTNTGTIVGTFSGVVAQTGTIGSINNSGLISGATTQTVSGFPSSPYTGIFALAAGTIGAVTNTGTITGLFNAIKIDSTSTIGPITNSGVIAGNIANAGTASLTLNGGGGSVFGTLTGISGLGTITNTASNLQFGSGNLLLNDSINVGSHTVTNTGATLALNAPMTITGNYSQGAGAALLLGVGAGAVTNGLTGDTGYGRLVVSGNATIASGSTVQLRSQGYAFAAGQRYVVVDAGGTGTYNESALHYAAQGFSGTVTGQAVSSADHQDLVLTLANNPSSPSSPSNPSSPSSPSSPSTPAQPTVTATTPNAFSALLGLAHYTGISDPQLLNLYNAAAALAVGSTEAANRAGTQLAPIQQSAAARAAAAPTFDALNIVAAHMDSLRLAGGSGGGSQTGIATGEASPKWGVWGQAFGGHASQGTIDQVDGYSANYGGLLIGADRALDERWRAGGVFSYSNTLIDGSGNTSGSSTRVNAYGLLGYASYIADRWYANLSAGAVAQHYDTTRQIGFTGFSGVANGRFDGQQYVARGEVGYPLALGSLTVTPLADLTYSYLHQGGYTESGGSGAALSVGAAHSTSVRSGLGVRLERGFATSYGQLVPSLQAQWIHEYDHGQPTTGASFAGDPTGQTAFTTVGANPIDDLADLSLGVTVLRANNLSLTVRYEVQAAPRFVSQTGAIRMRQLF